MEEIESRRGHEANESREMRQRDAEAERAAKENEIAMRAAVFMGSSCYADGIIHGFAAAADTHRFIAEISVWTLQSPTADV